MYGRKTDRIQHSINLLVDSFGTDRDSIACAFDLNAGGFLTVRSLNQFVCVRQGHMFISCNHKLG